MAIADYLIRAIAGALAVIAGLAALRGLADHSSLWGLGGLLVALLAALVYLVAGLAIQSRSR